MKIKKYLYYLSLFLLFFSLASSLFFLFKVKERYQLIDELIIDVKAKRKNLNNIEHIAVSLSKEIYKKTNQAITKEGMDLYSKIECTSFFNVTSAVSLKYGSYGIIGHYATGPCGTMSRTLLNALWSLNIPARKLQLINNELGKGGGHTMIEYFHNGSWRVLAPSDNTFVWYTEDGEIATARQIQVNPNIFSQIYTVEANYPYLFDNYKNIHWEKLPNWITTIIKFVIGDSKYNTSQTPKLYDLPRTLFLYCSILSSIFFLIMTYILMPKKLIK